MSIIRLSPVRDLTPCTTDLGSELTDMQREMNRMLDDYMAFRKWTSDGVPTPEKLKELEIA